jgi:hypothetical protein
LDRFNIPDAVDRASLFPDAGTAGNRANISSKDDLLELLVLLLLLLAVVVVDLLLFQPLFAVVSFRTLSKTLSKSVDRSRGCPLSPWLGLILSLLLDMSFVVVTGDVPEAALLLLLLLLLLLGDDDFEDDGLDEMEVLGESRLRPPLDRRCC